MAPSTATKVRIFISSTAEDGDWARELDERLRRLGLGTFLDVQPPELDGAGFTWTCAASALSSCTASGTGDIDDTVTVVADGTLTELRRTGDCEADFVWHDQDGTGIVHIRFEPERGRFRGHWGASDPVPSLIFDGYRFGESPIS